jgi:signal transduction histidine kinase
MSKDFLRNLPLFAGLSDEDLSRLCDMAETVTVRAGEVLMEEGSLGDALFVILDGSFEITKRARERDLWIANRGPGEMLGELSVLEETPRSATVRAATDCHLVKICRADFQQLLTKSSTAAVAMLRTVTARLRNTELMLRQSEKMAALGTLSAGLAHELNNPAAAVRRSATQLRESLAGLQRHAAGLGALDPSPEAMAVVNTLRMELPQRAASPAKFDPLARSDLEGEVSDWLDEQGVEEPWELAPAIVALGWRAADLGALVEPFTATQKPVFLCWLATACTVYALLDEVGQGAGRISEIVQAVKSYSYLDQAPVQLVDVHEGLENTLVILRHKLRGGVTVAKEYAADLPRIEAYASELNQVWTNLIDNAIDAMDGRGEMRIRTYGRARPADGGEHQEVVVEISDNGPGISPELQSRIFDAFFTTKEPGKGTGLGLHITYNIVVNQHHGEIKVESQPGQTTFRVILPVQLNRERTPEVKPNS